MNVELSETARRRVERMVADGTYPSVDAALEAAIRMLDGQTRPPTSAQIAEAADRGRADFAAGRSRDGESVARELRARIARMPLR